MMAPELSPEQTSRRVDEIVGAISVLVFDHKQYIRDKRLTRAARSLWKVQALLPELDECVSRLANGLRDPG